MPNNDPVIDAIFVDHFNRELAALSCSATVRLSDITSQTDVLELRDDEDTLVTLLPISATPEMTAIAYKLYGQGLNRGVRAGEDAAWAKLRHLIGAIGTID